MLDPRAYEQQQADLQTADDADALRERYGEPSAEVVLRAISPAPDSEAP